MLSASYVQIKKNDLTSNHILFKTDDATNLVVIFPGGGNSCERPVLNFLRKYYLDNQTDVLCISYTNTYLQDDEDDIAIQKIVDAVEAAISKVNEHKNYQKTYYICESMGNIIANALKIKYPDFIAKSAYISPTKEGLEYIHKYPHLIITGTKDEYLDEPTIEELKMSANDNLLIIEGATHTLMVDDVFESIDIVKVAVKRIINYLG